MTLIKKTVTAIIIVIGVVILMSAAAVLLPELNSAGLNSSDLCASASCFYNSSRSVDCTGTNTTPTDTAECTTAGGTMPLSSLFNTSGIMPLVFGAVVIIMAILFLLLIFRKKMGK